MVRSVWLLLITLIVMPLYMQADDFPPPNYKPRKYSVYEREGTKEWVDSIYNSLTIRERIGQLFMVAAYSNRNEKHIAELEKLIKEYGIGGLIFFQGGPVRQAKMCNYLQAQSRVKMLIGMDAEWGLSMRLDSTPVYPLQITYGASKEVMDAYKLGAEMAWQCQRMGVHISFSPVADLNNNPLNPVIGARAFGENKVEVSNRCLAFMRGLQDNGIMANAKHFPGHGDVNTDSHYALPVINKTREAIDTLELYPFQTLTEAGILSVMVGHLHLPKIDSTPNIPATLSPAIVNDILRRDMDYKGLVFTDALNMKGISNFHKAGSAELLAFKAGVDIMLFPTDVPVAIQAFEKALAENDITEKQLEKSVKRVLAAKYWSGLNEYKAIDVKSLYADLNMSATQGYIEEVFTNAATLVNNRVERLPIKNLEKQKFIVLEINPQKSNAFLSYARKYTEATYISIEQKDLEGSKADSLLRELAKTNATILIGLHRVNKKASILSLLNEATHTFLNKLENQNKVVLTVFGNPYVLSKFAQFETVLCMYEDNAFTHKIAPQIIFGALPAKGAIPVQVPGLEKKKILESDSSTSITLSSIGRLQYRHPYAVGMREDDLALIDTLLAKCLRDSVAPGFQVLVAREGKVIYEKAFGKLSASPSDTTKVTLEHIYDIASITKVAFIVPAIMHLVENQTLRLDNKIATYLPELNGTNKRHITLRQLLTHQAGLVPFIQFFRKDLDSTGKNLSYKFFKTSPDFWNNLQVADSLYTNRSTADSIYKWTIASENIAVQRDSTFPYRYSDLSFIILKRLADKYLDNQSEEWIANNVFQKLGLRTLGFRPLERFPKEQIAPTELDKQFRKSLVRGTVHDPTAAMAGGIEGNAGLFSNANDLAIFMQMMLNQGEYAGIRYFRPTTTNIFSIRQIIGHRGLGWDKAPIPNINGNTSPMASDKAFGHTGFTGTSAWADPKYNLVFIFLSNRVNPSADNKKLLDRSIRPKVMDIVYKAIEKMGPNTASQDKGFLQPVGLQK